MTVHIVWYITMSQHPTRSRTEMRSPGYQNTLHYLFPAIPIALPLALAPPAVAPLVALVLAAILLRPEARESGLAPEYPAKCV